MYVLIIDNEWIWEGTYEQCERMMELDMDSDEYHSYEIREV